MSKGEPEQEGFHPLLVDGVEELMERLTEDDITDPEKAGELTDYYLAKNSVLVEGNEYVEISEERIVKAVQAGMNKYDHELD